MDFFQKFRNIQIGIKDSLAWDTTSSFFENLLITNKNDESKSALIQMDESGHYDIIGVYKRVMNLLSNKSQNSNFDNTITTKLEWIVENSKNAREIRLAKEQLWELEQQVTTNDLKTIFKNRAIQIIDNFRKSCEDSGILFFDKSLLYIDPIKRNTQKELLETFLSVCQEYVHIKTSKSYISSTCCDSPKIISDSTNTFCETCQTIFTDIDNAGSFLDQKKITSVGKPKQYNIKHFVTAIKKSQGIHKKIIDPEVDIKQDEFMKHHKLPLDDYTIFHLRDLLQRDSQLSKYYKDIHLIYRQKTGKQINNLSNVEKDLPKWYKEQDQLSETIKLKSKSKNSINAYYMVCRLSQIHGRIDLSLENFFCARDSETIKEYDKCFEKRCHILGWLQPNEKLLDFCH